MLNFEKSGLGHPRKDIAERVGIDDVLRGSPGLRGYPDSFVMEIFTAKLELCFGVGWIDDLGG